MTMDSSHVVPWTREIPVKDDIVAENLAKNFSGK